MCVHTRFSEAWKYCENNLHGLYPAYIMQSQSYWKTQLKVITVPQPILSHHLWLQALP